MTPALPSLLRHAAAAVFLGVMAVVWTFPLVTKLSSHLPGGGAGDNVAFLWTFWWMRTAIDRGHDFFRTSYLFAPAGVDLTLHTHTALNAFSGATLLAELPEVAALNVATLVSVFLSGLAAYFLAWRITGHAPAAAVAGLVYGGSPFMSAHLNGHFNLTSAWTLPVFALALSEAMARPSIRWAIAAGLALGITVFVDYYLFVFQVILALTLFLTEAIGVDLRAGPRRPVNDPVVRLVAVLIGIDLAVLIAIWMTGGFSFRVSGTSLSMRSTLNPLQAFWILVAAGAWALYRPRLAVTMRPEFDGRSLTRIGIAAALASLVAAAPIVWKGMLLLAHGEYVPAPSFWRSAPKGIDLATLALGNPFHGFWGAGVQRIYERLDIDAIEASAWLGILPAILAFGVIRRKWQMTAVRQWTTIATVFFVWSLGSHLMVFGMNTGLILPHAAVRLVPILSNARIPGRAMIVVYLALAVLIAIALADYRSRMRRRRLLTTLIGATIAVDFLPAPFPLTRLEHLALYDALRDRPETGAVCELPFGFRDGFGERGRFDDRILFYQTIHERPLVGGFVARLPSRVSRFYEQDPLFATLLGLSGDTDAPAVAAPDRALAGRLMEQHGVRFLIVDRRTATDELMTYIDRTLPVVPVVTEDQRTLYVVTKP